MSDDKNNNSNNQNTGTQKPNPAKNVHAPTLPVKNQYSYDYTNVEKRDKK